MNIIFIKLFAKVHLMMSFLKRIILNRNTILVFAVAAGLLAGDAASFLKDYTFLALAVTMAFSMTGISLVYLKNASNIPKPMIMGVLLNYIYMVNAKLIRNNKLLKKVNLAQRESEHLVTFFYVLLFFFKFK